MSMSCLGSTSGPLRTSHHGHDMEHEKAPDSCGGRRGLSLLRCDGDHSGYFSRVSLV